MDPLGAIFADEPLAPIDGIEAWWARHRARTVGLARPIDRAIAGGSGADRPAWAFASGYVSALQALVPSLDPSTRAALLATEEGGGHPRAIATRLEGGRVTGKKRWATLATHVDALFVVASTGTGPDGRNRLKVVRVDPRDPGVRLAPMPPPPFAPEIPHAFAELDGAAVVEELEGDGYERHLKPFRTIEDAHVVAALVAWVARVGKTHRWNAASIEALLGGLAALRGVADLDPSAPSTHVALSGTLAGVERALRDVDPLWASVDDATRAFWRRDEPLLSVAASARKLRAEAARRALGLSG